MRSQQWSTNLYASFLVDCSTVAWENMVVLLLHLCWKSDGGGGTCYETVLVVAMTSSGWSLLIRVLKLTNFCKYMYFVYGPAVVLNVAVLILWIWLLGLSDLQKFSFELSLILVVTTCILLWVVVTCCRLLGYPLLIEAILEIGFLGLLGQQHPVLEIHVFCKNSS